MLIQGAPKEIGRERYETFEDCTAASHQKMLDYGKQGLYNVTIECKKING